MIQNNALDIDFIKYLVFTIYIMQYHTNIRLKFWSQQCNYIMPQTYYAMIYVLGLCFMNKLKCVFLTFMFLNDSLYKTCNKWLTKRLYFMRVDENIYIYIYTHCSSALSRFTMFQRLVSLTLRFCAIQILTMELLFYMISKKEFKIIAHCHILSLFHLSLFQPVSSSQRALTSLMPPLSTNGIPSNKPS
jgi:hypothetical protein